MRLPSWNIHKGIGGRGRRQSLARIIDCIEAENPDGICLQEVDRHVRRSRQGAGHESSGDYIEFLDRKSGETVGHQTYNMRFKQKLNSAEPKDAHDKK